MCSRVASDPSGSRTVSRRTCRSLPSNTGSEETFVSIRCLSRGSVTRPRLPQLATTVLRVGRARSLADAPCGPYGFAPARSFEPIPRDEEIGVEPRLRRPRHGLPVVAPLHKGGQRHQDGFRAPAGLQPEQRAAVPDQVELDVAAAPVCLEVALPFAVRDVLPALENGSIRLQEMVADAPDEGEAAVEAALREIVEEHA